MPRTYRAVLIGCGRMGATIDDEVTGRPHNKRPLPYSHAAAVAACDRTELVAVADVAREKAETAAQRYGSSGCYTDYREMIERESPEIVCIATRPATHAEATIFASEHGVRAIYCVKPLCCSMAEADAMKAAVRKHGVRFEYGAQRRYMPIYRTIRQMVEAGDVGTLQCVIVQQGTSAALWGLTHGVDMMLFLAGDPGVDDVQGTIICEESDWEGNRLNTDPGISSGYVRFSNGAHGYITAAGGVEFEVCGTGGKLRTYNNDMACTYRKATDTAWTLVEAPFPDVPMESGTLNAMRDIADALDTGRETLGSIDVAHRSMEIVFGIIASHRQGGKRISFPIESRDMYVGREGW